MPFTTRGPLVRGLIVAIAAGALLARLGPFDTFSDLPPAERAAYWIGLTVLLAVQILIAEQLLRAHAVRLHWIAAVVIAGLLGSIPSAFEVAWAESLLRVQRDLGPTDIIKIYGDVALIAVPLAAVMRIAMAPRAQPGPAPVGDVQRLLSALPQHRRGELLAFAAEDHYLRVFTDKGDELILRRFGDALANVTGLPGAQVHRSWWVAAYAVDHSERERERTFIVLKNGIRVPISRTYAVAAREAGLLGK